MKIKNTKTNEEQTIVVNAFFVATGYEPNSIIFKGWIDMDEAGYIKPFPVQLKQQALI